MRTTNIQAITYDAAGTLIHLAEPVGVSYSTVAARHGISSAPERLDAAFKTVWKRTPLPFDDRAPRDPNEKAWWQRVVHDVFAESGVALPDNDVFAVFFEDLYEHFETPGTWLADPDAEEVLAKTGEKYRLAVLSNFDARLRRILSDLSLLGHFEKVFLSCEIGASKPDSKIFKTAARGLDLAPESILHIGDDPECDGDGSARAGFHHFQVGNTAPPLGKLIDELSLA
ncbi:HAD-IA family hydrolase [Verrucomicrobiales bacterium]|jgi:putative hydrolase of the HAD superfamily|nr:HAD-IA family hydrolase [Verrucomicrobiales bacterium]MDB3941675.1 HAD-IA family hydrolase [Verrucomicrobiales bacterium]